MNASTHTLRFTKSTVPGKRRRWQDLTQYAVSVDGVCIGYVGSSQGSGTASLWSTYDVRGRFIGTGHETRRDAGDSLARGMERLAEAKAETEAPAPASVWSDVYRARIAQGATPAEAMASADRAAARIRCTHPAPATEWYGVSGGYNVTCRTCGTGWFDPRSFAPDDAARVTERPTYADRAVAAQGFRITERAHRVCVTCDHAAVLAMETARVTGSTGATYDNGGGHVSTVARRS